MLESRLPPLCWLPVAPRGWHWDFRTTSRPRRAALLTSGADQSHADGLIFIAGTLDAAIRAYDISTGKELWRGELPTNARSTPMTYRGPNGEQYLVIAAGGHGIPGGPLLGDYLVAFALR